jgi:hypothetical protein
MSDLIIKKAVKLADGFSIDKAGVYWIHEDYCCYPEEVNDSGGLEWFKDALAAQLVRQVDAKKDWEFHSILGEALMVLLDEYTVEFSANGNDRTMNTINAICDSGVLEESNDE